MKRLLVCLLLITFAFGCKKRNAIAYNDSIPKHDSFVVSSQFVDEDRVINVFTPPTYAETDERFPVLYMPDGGVKEDFPHIANTLVKLIEENKIPPFILVGIENTERGRDLTGASSVKKHEKYKIPMTDGAKNFRAFITQELMPKINQEYRTTNQKGIIGESLAGLFVMETFFLQPEAFDMFIAMDPSLWWNKNHLVKNADEYLKNLPSDKKTKLWFACSDAKDIAQYSQQLAAYLEKNQPENLIWKFSDEPNEKHHTIYRATKEKAMTWALGE